MITKELVERWCYDWGQETVFTDQFHYIAQRAADHAVAQLEDEILEVVYGYTANLSYNDDFEAEIASMTQDVSQQRVDDLERVNQGLLEDAARLEWIQRKQ